MYLSSLIVNYVFCFHDLDIGFYMGVEWYHMPSNIKLVGLGGYWKVKRWTMHKSWEEVLLFIPYLLYLLDVWSPSRLINWLQINWFIARSDAPTHSLIISDFFFPSPLNSRLLKTPYWSCDFYFQLLVYSLQISFSL